LIIKISFFDKINDVAIVDTFKEIYSAYTTVPVHINSTTKRRL